MCQETHEANGNEAEEEGFDGKGNVAGFLSGHQGGVCAREFDRDIGGGISRADDQDLARAELGRVAIVGRMYLQDSGVEILCERRSTRRPVRTGRWKRCE